MTHISYKRCDYEKMCWYSIFKYYLPDVEEERQRIMTQYLNIDFSDDWQEFCSPNEFTTRLTIKLKFKNDADEAEFIMKELVR